MGLLILSMPCISFVIGPTGLAGPRWQSCSPPLNRGLVPGPTSSRKAGSCLPLVGS